MQIFLRAQNVEVIDVEPTLSVQALKQMVEEFEGVAEDDQMITFEGKSLVSGVLADYGVVEHSTIHLDQRLLGGKVHGSLARAGKVKGQTPKVEAGEKKKKKTGRAKRRLQYNRRFVSVVPSFGKKKGPNSNAT